MKTISIYQVDAFTDNVFGGNPAAVCILDYWLEAELLQKIASENFLPETAFLVQSDKSSTFDLRWFTPEIEMDLCGHATLASAFVVFNFINTNLNEVRFTSKSGDLLVPRNEDLLCLNFPSRMPVKTDLPDIILKGIGVAPIEVYKSRDYVLVYENEEIIRNINPSKEILNQINIDPGGIIITAPGNEVDFVSRFFTPQASIFEDPVTGSAHSSLIPFWSKRLNKENLKALQLSNRLGILTCENLENRVLISGSCKLYLKGEIFI